ncbi:MAG TPA: VWA domain-containing protein [Solirubrobacteraceae bacterium]|nr:VWA domain-containing protein [Solirubrobacteraceae bacterium]
MADNDPTGPGTALEIFNPRLNEDNPEPRAMCILLLDTSDSMNEPKAQPPIDELNEGLVRFVNDLREDTKAQNRVELAVISFGGQVTVEHEFSEAGDFTPSTLTAGGGTPLSGAILAALDKFDDRKREYISLGINFYMPWLIIMTDGRPTDLPDVTAAALERLQRWQAEKRVTVFPVGVGDKTDFEFLRRTSDRPPLRLKTANLREFFEWVSTNLKKVSDGANYASSDQERAEGGDAGEQTPLAPPPAEWFRA